MASSSLDRSRAGCKPPLCLLVCVMTGLPAGRAQAQGNNAEALQIVTSLKRLEQLGRYREALEELHRLLPRFPRSGALHLHRCELLFQLDQKVDAQGCLTQLSELTLDDTAQQVKRGLEQDLRISAPLAVKAPPPLPPPPPLIITTTKPLPGRSSVRSLGRSPWLWGSVGIAASALTLGLLLGQLPRSYREGAWR